LVEESARGKSTEDFLITRENGKPIKDFRKAWRSLCIGAGVGKMICKSCGNAVQESRCACGSKKLKYDGLMVHDMRRTAARNLRKEGVPESVIMKIGGWRTRSTFERYNIVDEADTRDALQRLEEAQQRENEHKVEHNLPTETTKELTTKTEQVN
jgi:integrase